MWRRPACQDQLSKSMNISSAIARVAPNLLKALAIPSDTTVRRSTVDKEDLTGNQKRPHFSRWSTVLLFTSSSNFTNHRKRLKGLQMFAVDLSSTFLNTRTTDETFKQSAKQDFFRRLIRNSNSIYERHSSLEPLLVYN